MKHRSTTPSQLSDSLNHHLNMYATAASAAGVGLLALAPLADARIVYTPAHVVIQKHTNITRFLDLNHDAIKDFKLIHIHNHSSRFSYSGLDVRGENGSNQAMGSGNGRAGYSAYALVAGAKIGPGKWFVGLNTLMASATSPGSGVRGDWANSGKGVKKRYLGLQFLIKGKLHYGWARLNVTIVFEGQGHSIAALLTGYAYETVANKPIIAGKTHDADDNDEQLNPASIAVPAPKSTTLGALAMGWPGLSIWRRRSQ